jgi:hypothetical protein
MYDTQATEVTGTIAKDDTLIRNKFKVILSVLSHIIPSPLQGEKARMRGEQHSCSTA